MRTSFKAFAQLKALGSLEERLEIGCRLPAGHVQVVEKHVRERRLCRLATRCV